MDAVCKVCKDGVVTGGVGRCLTWGLLVLVLSVGTWLWSSGQLHTAAPLAAANPAGSDALLYEQLRTISTTRGGSWLRTLHPEMQEVQGDLLWNNTQQRGVLRLVNLPEPRKGYQYRLWIHDSRRIPQEPLPLLTLPHGSGRLERFMAFTASEPVFDPYKFVLTLESMTGQGESQIVLMAQL